MNNLGEIDEPQLILGCLQLYNIRIHVSCFQKRNALFPHALGYKHGLSFFHEYV
jgi:hypothetical protein